MKKILSLILAITMIATFALATSADEIKAGNKNDNMNVSDDGVFTVTNDGQWACYVLGESTNWEVTMTLKRWGPTGGEYGLQICASDDNGDGIILEGDDSFFQVFMNVNSEIRTIGCDNGWGNVAGYDWDANNKDVARSTGVDGDLTLTVKLNGNNLSYWVGDQQCGETIVLADELIYGNIVTLVMKHTQTEISNVTFIDHNAKIETPETPETSEIPEIPETPKTGEAGAVVALVSVLALAGVVIASKKRA